MPVNLPDIKKAAAILKGVIHRTPLDHSRTFSALTGAEIYLKLENLQKTGSFKIRGAYNKMQSLTDSQRQKGVIAASAGNHAQGVAFAATRAGIKATVVMPQNAPLAKIAATKGYGAEVVLVGHVYDESYARAKELQRETGQTFIHAFDDEEIIAGQGTIGLEILEDLQDAAAIVAPVGGGGLLAGIAAAVKNASPRVKIYGVQSTGAGAMYASKQSHQICSTKDAKTIADGIAVKTPGELTFPLIEKYADDIVVVDDEEAANTILMLLERAKLMVEGAGAVSLAAVLNKKIAQTGKIVSVISGGNVDVSFIAHIIERGLIQAGRRVRLLTELPDLPGSLQRMLAIIARREANVLQISHDRLDSHVSFGQTLVEIRLETRDFLHAGEVVRALEENGYKVQKY